MPPGLVLAESQLEWLKVWLTKQNLDTGIPLATKKAVRTAALQIMLALKEGFSGEFCRY